MEWADIRTTSSLALRPASANRERIDSAESRNNIVNRFMLRKRNVQGLPVTSGTEKSAAGINGNGRPRRNSKRGAPGQVLRPTAAAKWSLKNTSVIYMSGVVLDHKELTGLRGKHYAFQQVYLIGIQILGGRCSQDIRVRRHRKQG